MLFRVYVEYGVFLQGLVVGADLPVGAQHLIERLEHVAHADLRYRAFHHHDEFRLVGGGADQAPGAVLDRDAYAVDRYEIADRLPRHSGATWLAIARSWAAHFSIRTFSCPGCDQACRRSRSPK